MENKSPHLHAPRLQRPRLASPLPPGITVSKEGGGGEHSQQPQWSAAHPNSRPRSPQPPLNLAIPKTQESLARRTPSFEGLRLDTSRPVMENGKTLPHQEARGEGGANCASMPNMGGPLSTSVSTLTQDLQRAILSDVPARKSRISNQPPSQSSREATPPSAGSSASTASAALSNARASFSEGTTSWDIGALHPQDIEPLDRIGEGTGGEVHRVRHRPTGVIMAKKTIPTSPQIHRQLLREISFLRSTSSSYVIRYYGALLAAPDDGSLISIFMEFAEGGSLESIYRTVKKRGGRTGEKVLGKIAEGVLEGLGYLHERKIIHRDIKPSNILVTRNGEIKLCDFGVSGELVNSIAGTFTGTSYYMAPERIQGRPYSITSDVWSLGLTIMEVALDRFPFPEPGEPPLGPIDLLTYVVHRGIPDLHTAEETGRKEEDRIQWTSGICSFLEYCLDRNPQRRPHPVDLLKHPWIVKSHSRRVNMARWIKEVWEWPD